MSKSTVSRICQAIAAEFDAWSSRRLDDVELDYLFLDASHFTLHAAAQPVFTYQPAALYRVLQAA